MPKMIAFARRRFAVFAHDLAMVAVAWGGACWLRLKFGEIPETYSGGAVQTLMVVVPIQVAAFWLFGLYRGIWRFASLPDLIRIGKAVLAGTLVAAIALFMTTRLEWVPQATLPLYLILLCGLLVGPRLVYRWFKDNYLTGAAGLQVAVVGAGQVSKLPVRDLLPEPEHRYRPAAFLDDNPEKCGQAISSVRVGAGLTATSLQPRNLHITHSWGGGTSRWVEDFCRFDPYSENFIFESLTFGECYGLSYRLTGGRMLRVAREWTLQRPIAEVVVSHNEYAALLNRVVEDLGIDHLYISSVIGHSLDAYALDVPTTVVYHDYFPFCPALNVYFGAVCETCKRDELARCLRENPFSRLFSRHNEGYWTEVREAFFERFERRPAHHVAPIQGVVENLCRLDARFNGFDFSIIPHGVAFAKGNVFGGAHDGRRLRMIVLGRLDVGKGLETFGRLCDLLRCLADIYLVGSGAGGKAFANRFGVQVTPSYDHAALPDILSSIRPDVALLLSAVPETFSFTLSELWAHSVPVVATRIGSFAERITPELDGFLVGGTDEAIADEIVELDTHRYRLRRVADHLASREVRHVSTEVDDYFKLQSGFADALERRIESQLASKRR